MISLAVAALLASACGSGSEPAAISTTTSAVSETTASTEPDAPTTTNAEDEPDIETVEY